MDKKKLDRYDEALRLATKLTKLAGEFDTIGGVFDLIDALREGGAKLRRPKAKAPRPKGRPTLKRKLADEYKLVIGYDPFEDDPTITVEEVKEILRGYKEEAAREEEDK